jgi:hypothetical protein
MVSMGIYREATVMRSPKSPEFGGIPTTGVVGLRILERKPAKI